MLISDNTDLISGGLWDMDSGIDAIYQPPGIRPVFTIPLISSIAASKGAVVPTFTRDTTGTYIDANGVLQTAAIDSPRFENSMFLSENDATNLVVYSNDLYSRGATASNALLYTSNQAVGPDGSMSMTLLYIAADRSYTTYVENPRFYTAAVSTTKGNTYTYSLYAKYKNLQWIKLRFDASGAFKGANFDILNGVVGTVDSNYTASIEHVGNGIYRCSVTTTAPSAGILPAVHLLESNGSIGTIYANKGCYIYGEQVELSSYATSYIPTNGTTVTRTDDNLLYPLSTVLTQGKGSLYCEFKFTSVNASACPHVFSLNDGTANNRIRVFLTENLRLYLNVHSAGSIVVDTYHTALTADTVHKVMVTYEDNNVSFYVDGALVSTDTLCTIPTSMTRVNVGSDRNGDNQLNGHVGNVKYYSAPLTQAQAIKATT